MTKLSYLTWALPSGNEYSLTCATTLTESVLRVLKRHMIEPEVEEIDSCFVYREGLSAKIMADTVTPEDCAECLGGIISESHWDEYNSIMWTPGDPWDFVYEQ